MTIDIVPYTAQCGYSEWLREGRQRLGVRVPIGSIPALGPTQSPAIQLIPEGVKRMGREASDSLLTNAQEKKTWISTSTPHTS
jgi:hypothetical protein